MKLEVDRKNEEQEKEKISNEQKQENPEKQSQPVQKNNILYIELDFIYDDNDAFILYKVISNFII